MYTYRVYITHVGCAITPSRVEVHKKATYCTWCTIRATCKVTGGTIRRRDSIYSWPSNTAMTRRTKSADEVPASQRNKTKKLNVDSGRKQKHQVSPFHWCRHTLVRQQRWVEVRSEISGNRHPREPAWLLLEHLSLRSTVHFGAAGQKATEMHNCLTATLKILSSKRWSWADIGEALFCLSCNANQSSWS